MLFPKKAKYRKWQRARKNPLKRIRPETRGVTVDFGSYGLKAMSPGRVRSNQLEAARKTMARVVSKTGKIWTRVFPDRPYTQKGAEVPMGKGKGDVQGYEFEVSPGRILFEVDGVTAAVASEALRKAGAKLPLKTKIVTRI
ncbi:MAG TPA: 50S ribosomal protein L16 [Candidatus Paceibacterota bacterium]